MGLNRRQFLAAGLGAVGAVVAAGGLTRQVWPMLAREDLVPGEAPDMVLPPLAWDTTRDRVTFAALGDNGSGGRQAMAVATELARTYRAAPFGVVALLGDICYYGPIQKRFDDVFRKPLGPLIDAGVGFELAIGNHDGNLDYSQAGLEEIEAELALLGTPGRYYTTTHGPVDFFYLDSSVPSLSGVNGAGQLAWLDDVLARSTNQWRVVCMHHPPFSSGYHGSALHVRERVVPILERHRVDLVLAGHDHHYERTRPIDGVTYVVSGGGCKRTPVGRSDFTAVADSILEFLHVEVDGDRLSARCIQPDGHVADRFELRARRS